MLVWVWASFVLLATHTANRSLIDALWYLIWTSPLWYLHHCVCDPQCQWVWVIVSTNLIHAIKQPLAREILTQSINHYVSIRLIQLALDQSINHHHWETLTRIVCSWKRHTILDSNLWLVIIIINNFHSLFRWWWWFCCFAALPLSL